ncbi:MAG: phosphonate ABC transporter ATP-binding protein [Proteobacteria bacterium]|nr:phosphonate ABC transporter ATP-binding protein [Pseudomonadota bacterium]MBU1594175.1 phosphonate ABC transporter ATP-binding protein [Pseudomonadota bacterium]
MLTIQGLTKSYQAHTALHPTDLTFEASRFSVLLGPSGAGKSTLLRCLNQLTVPTGGTVEVEGVGPIDTASKRHALRCMTGFVFQQHQLILRQTALANVLNGRLGCTPLWKSLLPWSRNDVTEALGCLERVGLLDFALIRAGRLSGGQQQRVGIARALAQKPRIILADEPVASLDPAKSEEILDLLLEICREDGICTVVSLHQVDLARKFADRIIALKDGRVVFDAPPSELSESALEEIYSSGGDVSSQPEEETGEDELAVLEAKAA